MTDSPLKKAIVHSKCRFCNQNGECALKMALLQNKSYIISPSQKSASLAYKKYQTFTCHFMSEYFFRVSMRESNISVINAAMQPQVCRA